MDKNTSNGEKVSATCPLCQGTGFRNGKLCSCITGQQPEIPDALKEMFGDIFKKGAK